jgi:Tol biopolymer transport system component
VDVMPISGSDGATHPSVSPDGTRVAFFAGGDLKIASFDGTVASAVDKAGPDPRGLCWIDDRTLVYSPDATAGLLKTSIDGGDATPLTTLDAERNERTHRWPVAVDGGKAVLFTIGDNSSPDDYETATIGAVIVASGERREVYRGASMALPTSAGHLLLARAGVLSAVAFDADRLTTSGPVVQVLSGVSGDRTTGVAHVAVSRNGTLAYIPGDDQKGSLRRLVWADAGGDLTPVPGLDAQIYNDIRLSPDGTRLAALVGPTGSGDVWTYDVARGTFTRLTFTTTNAAPVWSPDGKTVYYVSIAGSGLKTELWRRPADGSREAEMVFALDSRAYVTNVGEDAIVFDGYAPNKPLIRVPDGDPAKEETILESPFSVFAAEVSPDGRWLAYQSNETGRYEVYVRDLMPGGGRYQVSTALGEEPHWSRDGTSLYYRADEALMAVPVTTEPTFSAGTPRLLFRGIYNLRSDTGISFTVAPDGRFMMIRPAVDNQTPPVVELVLNWFDELRARTAR